MRLELIVLHRFEDKEPEHEPPAQPVMGMLSEVLRIIKTLESNMSKTSDALTDLTAAVAGQASVIESAKAVVAGIPAVVAAAVSEALANSGVDDATTAAAIEAAVTSVRAETDDLGAALSANTPDASTPGSDPVADPAADPSAPGDDSGFVPADDTSQG